MEMIHLDEVAGQIPERPAAYFEFFRAPALSAGVYRLEAGAVDPQLPHHEDEIYVIRSGSGKIRVENEVRSVRAGDFIYVPAGAQHRFLDINEALEILVVFAPAET